MAMKKLNNKGYMLVEIILASAIAFLVIYFIIDLTVKMKNKNDDMYVKTLVTTDQTIVTKKLMDYAMVEQEEFDCGSLKIDGRSILYKEEVITVISDYANVGSLKCSNEYNKISIAIPLDVKQQVDEDFDIVVDYRYGSFDVEPPTCSLSINKGKISVKLSDDGSEGTYSSGLATYQWNDEEDALKYEEDVSVEKNITKTGIYKLIVLDNAKNKGECSVEVIDKDVENCKYYNVNATVKNGKCVWNSQRQTGNCSCGYAKGSCGCRASATTSVSYSGICNLYGNCNCNSGIVDWNNCHQPYAGNCSGNTCNCTGGTVLGNNCSMTNIENSRDIVYKCLNGYTDTGNNFCYKDL